MDFSVGEGAVPGRARNEWARAAWGICHGPDPVPGLVTVVVGVSWILILVLSWYVPDCK